LVSLADSVRRELAAPLSAARRDQLQSRVSQALEQLDEIVRRSGSRIDRLPAPSCRATVFLSSINWARLELTTEEAPHAGEQRVVWRGLQAFVARAMDRLAQPLDAPELERVRASIAKMSRQIEGSIERHKTRAEQLTPITRELRGWLAFFSREENLWSYSKARELAHVALTPAAQGQRRFSLPLTIHFRPMRGIYNVRGSRSGSNVLLPTPMIAFDAAGFARLASLMFAKERTARRDVVAQMAGEGYQSTYAELEILSGIIEESRGAYFDLRDSFDRVNATYFGGTMIRPRLTWSRSFTGRKFGHYDWIQDTVMVSRTLDAGDLREFLVDFIVYHELLHKKHGLHWVNGRGYAHTTEFYREERQFTHYHESESLLGELARGSGRITAPTGSSAWAGQVD
jgi:hypothetical protein